MKNRTGVIRHRFKKLHVYLARAAGRTETGRRPTEPRLSFLFSDKGCEAHVAIPPRSPDAMPDMDYKALEERIVRQLQGLTGKKLTVVLDEAHNLLALKKGW